MGMLSSQGDGNSSEADGKGMQTDGLKEVSI